MIWHITYNNIFIGYSYHDIYLSNEMYDHQAAYCEDPNCNITFKKHKHCELRSGGTCKFWFEF